MGAGFAGLGTGDDEVRYADGMLSEVSLLTFSVGGEYLAGEFRSATYILKFLSPRWNFWSWVTR